MQLTERFQIALGGQMSGTWTAGKLQITYTGQTMLTLRPDENSGWRALCPENPPLAAEVNDAPGSISRAYVSLSVALHIADTRRRAAGLDMDRLPEFLDCPFSPLAAAELLRILLDERDFDWERAWSVIGACRFSPAEQPWTFTIAEITAVQPRTAQLMEILKAAGTADPAIVRCFESQLSRLICHNSAEESYRFPIGALPTESAVALRLWDGSGLVQQATLILEGDGFHRVQELNRNFSCRVPLPETPVALRYYFRLRLVGNVTCLLCETFGKQVGRVSFTPGAGFRLTVYDRTFTTPAWFRHGVMYQIFPDRFARDSGDTAQKGIAYHENLGQTVYVSEWDAPVKWQPAPGETDYMPNDFYGGTLKGITQQLPYLQQLGVGILYLNPIVEACSNHRYDTADYLRPDPILGTMEDFRALCQSAKELGIRILLDGVYSHTGADSTYFNRYGHYDSMGACQSTHSPYYPWYDFSDYPDRYRCWWGFESLPEVNELAADWQEFVISGPDSVVRSWLKNGAAGWRLDVADELPDSVLTLIRQAAKETDPEAVVLGEVWEDAIEKESYGTKRTYALGNALDTVMNYPFRAAALRFLRGEDSAQALADFLLAQRLHYPPPMYYGLMNLLSSHDVARIRTLLAIVPEEMPAQRADQVARIVSDEEDRKGARLQQLAAAIAFAIPGTPCIYYGDETGMNGFTDPFNRAPFTQGAYPLTDWYRQLSALRNGSSPLQQGSFAVYAPDPDVLLMLRVNTSDRDRFGDAASPGLMLIAVNRSGDARTVNADLSAPGHGLTSEETGRLSMLSVPEISGCLGSGTARIDNGTAIVTLPSQSSVFFQIFSV